MKQVKEEEKKTRHKKIHFTLVNTRRLVFFRSEKKTRLSLVKIRRILFEKINNLQIKSRNLFPNKKKKSSESIGKKRKEKKIEPTVTKGIFHHTIDEFVFPVNIDNEPSLNPTANNCRY
jgi:hypothetical protein